ncbi:hypothetical protein [Novipirellula caenicola]|uniref:hypothetical protein n=1 Tax=Novipirellula caenicola TaxID=1536901 RepID=UPI0031EED006
MFFYLDHGDHVFIRECANERVQQHGATVVAEQHAHWGLHQFFTHQQPWQD